MPAEAGDPVAYTLAVGDARIALNDLMGRKVRIDFEGVIRCIHCDRTTKKSFNQGYCYPCFRKLAACDSCIMSPEKCHYHLGTCREPEWGEANCMVEHVVYLANSSGLKVGITRATQVPTRWIDQGAVTAIPMLRVASRYLSGLVEVACKNHVADRTNWRAMLKGDVPEHGPPVGAVGHMIFASHFHQTRQVTAGDPQHRYRRYRPLINPTGRHLGGPGNTHFQAAGVGQ